MNATPRLLTVFAAVAVLGAGGSAALAQQPQGGQQQQFDLASALHLRPDQMAAFHAFQAASQPKPDEVARMRGASPQILAGMSAPQRLDRIGTLLNTEVEVFHRSAEATKAFYAQLSPDQQHTFDRVTSPPQGQGGRSR